MKKLQTPSAGFHDISDRDNGELIVRLKEMLIIIINGEQTLEISLPISWQAVLSVNNTFMADYEPDISKRILFQKEYTSKKQCEQKNPKALAEAMSQAMAEISKTIIKDIHHSLTKRR